MLILGNLVWTVTFFDSLTYLPPGLFIMSRSASLRPWQTDPSEQMRNWKSQGNQLLFGWIINESVRSLLTLGVLELWCFSKVFQSMHMLIPKNRIFKTLELFRWWSFWSFSKQLWHYRHGSWRGVFAAARCGNLPWWFPPEARRVQCLQNKAHLLNWQQ